MLQAYHPQTVDNGLEADGEIGRLNWMAGRQGDVMTLLTALTA